MTLPKGLRSGTGYGYRPLFEQVTQNESLGERSMLLFSSKIIEPKLKQIVEKITASKLHMRTYWRIVFLTMSIELRLRDGGICREMLPYQ